MDPLIGKLVTSWSSYLLHKNIGFNTTMSIFSSILGDRNEYLYIFILRLIVKSLS